MGIFSWFRSNNAKEPPRQQPAVVSEVFMRLSVAVNKYRFHITSTVEETAEERSMAFIRVSNKQQEFLVIRFDEWTKQVLMAYKGTTLPAVAYEATAIAALGIEKIEEYAIEAGHMGKLDAIPKTVIEDHDVLRLQEQYGELLLEYVSVLAKTATIFSRTDLPAQQLRIVANTHRKGDKQVNDTVPAITLYLPTNYKRSTLDNFVFEAFVDTGNRGKELCVNWRGKNEYMPLNRFKDFCLYLRQILDAIKEELKQRGADLP